MGSRAGTRDAILAVSGTLNPERYGPAFKPPIPADAMVARNLKNPYPKDVPDGPAVQRRSVYAFHKRVIPYPRSIWSGKSPTNRSQTKTAQVSASCVSMSHLTGHYERVGPDGRAGRER